MEKFQFGITSGFETQTPVRIRLNSTFDTERIINTPDKCSHKQSTDWWQRVLYWRVLYWYPSTTCRYLLPTPPWLNSSLCIDYQSHLWWLQLSSHTGNLSTLVFEALFTEYSIVTATQGMLRRAILREKFFDILCGNVDVCMRKGRTPPM